LIVRSHSKFAPDSDVKRFVRYAHFLAIAYSVECTIALFASIPTIAKKLWIGFGDHSVHAKPCFNCVLLVQTYQGTLRFCP
jgi:hypothetical protein